MSELLRTELATAATEAERRLSALLDERDADLAPLFEGMRYSTLAGGKRIRPFLVMESARLFGGEISRAIYFAVALEMIHTYSLIHDDLPCMDNDDLRRGKPTNHKVYGEATATLAGDALLTGAFEILCAAALPAEVKLAAVRTLSEAAGAEGMVGGQIMDLAGEHKKLTLDQLLKLHSLKTGALISAAAVMGALAAGCEFEDACMEDVITYAENIGLAFQIVDDILDKTGDSAALGKNVGSDAAHEKNTFLSFYTVEEAQFYADRLTDEAIRAIRKYPGSDTLCSIAEWLAKRKK
jgi:geranylgeranyl diphosphate synthase type II